MENKSDHLPDVTKMMPAHIDLEAWEPCESCLSCDNCKNKNDYDPYEGTYGECGQCYGYAHFDPCNFCHECGKPLTPEALAMLEKRLSEYAKRRNLNKLGAAARWGKKKEALQDGSTSD